MAGSILLQSYPYSILSFVAVSSVKSRVGPNCNRMGFGLQTFPTTQTLPHLRFGFHTATSVPVTPSVSPQFLCSMQCVKDRVCVVGLEIL